MNYNELLERHQHNNRVADGIICVAIFIGMAIIGFAIMFAVDLEEQAWKNRHTQIINGQSCVVLPRN